MPQKVQIAFQGGGARFVEMLPIAHAFSLAHEKNLLITRVGGSSAGSICAALVARNADFVRVRQFIRTHGKARVKELRRWRMKPTEDVWLRRAKNVVATYTALRGSALFNTGALRDFLTALFDDALLTVDPRQPGVVFDKYRKASRAGVELVITGSDLATSKGVTLNGNDI